MNCPKCGTPAPEGAAICKVCNYVFPIGLRDDGEPSVPGVPMPKPPAHRPPPQAAPAQPSYQQPAQPPQPQAAPAQLPEPQVAPAQHPPPQGVVPGIIIERSSIQIILLGIVTCGIYVWWWWYRTTTELKQATGDESLNPGMDLLLVLVTGGLWGVYIEYRNTKKVHDILVQQDPARKDQSQTILIMRLVGLVIAILAFYAIHLTQEEYNALARASG